MVGLMDRRSVMEVRDTGVVLKFLLPARVESSREDPPAPTPSLAEPGAAILDV